MLSLNPFLISLIICFYQSDSLFQHSQNTGHMYLKASFSRHLRLCHAKPKSFLRSLLLYVSIGHIPCSSIPGTLFQECRNIPHFHYIKNTKTICQETQAALSVSCILFLRATHSLLRKFIYS